METIILLRLQPHGWEACAVNVAENGQFVKRGKWVLLHWTPKAMPETVIAWCNKNWPDVRVRYA